MRRFVLAGASSRALGMYALPVIQRYRDTAALVGIFDTNLIRAEYISRECGGVPVYSDFNQMLRYTQADTVVVSTVDRYHHEYIIGALEAGCDAITEKPMTIDAEKCRAILAAEKRTGKKVIVGFNYRFNPYMTRAKELLSNGTIGQVLSVDFEWLLDRKHGADYFRRWHRRKENSGGLLVHKATHHFDLINWWLSDEPDQVYAIGARRFYGPTRAERGERCSTCAYQNSCEFYVDYGADPLLQALYFAAESEDGYYRDQCVFSETIDIEDTMNVTVRYKSGAQLSYSLIAYAAYEGWRAAFNGTAGRMELELPESGPLATGPSLQIRVFNAQGEQVVHDIAKAGDDHGGGDARLLERLFGATSQPDPLGHMAGSRAGAMSVLIGIAANTSIASGKPVAIQDLL